MSQAVEEIRASIERWCANPRTVTAVAGLTLFRTLSPTVPLAGVYEPRLCVVVQGAKRVVLGSQVHAVDATSCFIATVDLPVTAMVSEASAQVPHLALTFGLDRAKIANLLLQSQPRRLQERHAAGFAVDRQPEALLAPLSRLLSLLGSPDDIPVLGQSIERELLYRLLQSDLGGYLAGYAQAGTHLSRIGAAIAWIRVHYAEPFSVEELAAHVGMSVTSFHRHFKQVTTLSPLRYRTEIRLREAQRQLLSGGQNAGAAAFAVGYGSQSQFTRDYHRLFGQPPLANVARLRGGSGQS